MRYVLKFGGSSLSTPSKIKSVANFIAKIKSRKATELVVVVSAMGKTTNKLATLCNSISDCPNEYTLASTLSKGEEVSANLLSLALDNLKIKNKVLLSKDVTIYVAGHPNNAIITHIDTKNIENLLQNGNVVIIPGFQGVDDNNNICTLGRGGSDTTACALASALNCAVKIYTDVPGFFNYNPHLFANAKKLEALDILSSIELASCGAKIMDQTSLEIAGASEQPLKVCESLTNTGTNIYKYEISNFKIFCISFKTNLLFVKNNKSNINNLQTKIKNDGFKILFSNFQKINNHFENIIISDIPYTFLNIKNNKQISQLRCEIVNISGTGLLSNEHFNNFMKELQYKFQKEILYINSTPTTIKIATKAKKSFEITKYINKNLNLENYLWKYSETIQHL